MIQEGVHHETQLIRQRKRLKYQVSDLISNSKNIVNEKMSHLKRLSEQGKRSYEMIRKKQKYVILQKNMMSKIKKYIGDIFQTLLSSASQEKKRSVNKNI